MTPIVHITTAEQLLTDKVTRQAQTIHVQELAIEALKADAERWKQLVFMNSLGATPNVLQFYMANPEKLDYASKLRIEHDAAMKEQS